MASFVDALREGYSRDTLREETDETIAAIANAPEWFLRSLHDPPTTVVLPGVVRSVIRSAAVFGAASVEKVSLMPSWSKLRTCGVPAVMSAREMV